MSTNNLLKFLKDKSLFISWDTRVNYIVYGIFNIIFQIIYNEILRISHINFEQGNFEVIRKIPSGKNMELIKFSRVLFFSLFILI